MYRRLAREAIRAELRRRGGEPKEPDPARPGEDRRRADRCDEGGLKRYPTAAGPDRSDRLATSAGSPTLLDGYLSKLLRRATSSPTTRRPGQGGDGDLEVQGQARARPCGGGRWRRPRRRCGSSRRC